MRVLAVGNMYPPHHLGGYELVWRSAMRYLRAHGHQARVLTSDFRISTDERDDAGTFRELRWYWRDHQWPRIGWRGRIALERHNAAVLERHLGESRPHVVCWWSMGGMSMALIERVRRLGMPAVAFVHDDWLLYAPAVDRWMRSFRGRPRIARIAECALGIPAAVDLENGARHVLVSETIRSRARAGGYRLADSSIAHSGIDPRYLDPRPERPWRWQLLFVGRIDERKGVIDAVEALAELPQQARLTLAGDGDRRVLASVRARAAQLGLADRVRQLGMCSREQLPGIYASADVVLFPVRWEEPWGLVPLEAMALGRPVIASGRGGSAEYLRGEVNCLLAGAGDPTAIARAVARLAADPELRERLRAAGFETAAGHPETVFNEAVLAALEGALGQARFS